MNTTKIIAIESAGSRKRESQSISDRMREIKSEEGWVDISDLVRTKNSAGLKPA